ncbi:ATP-binding protein [Lewinella sp. LCG006]|uniref:ATP-binding protein n=1 Tax=Lewinella sp. LCG006 TaxID=3231911 RepID=UPI003460FEE6
MRFKTYLVLLFLMLLASPLIVNAQTATKTISLGKYQIKAKLWTRDDGIPHWHLNGIFQDSRGLVWANWKGKLSRFDGRKWVVVSSRPEKLHSFFATSIAEDVYHNIWSTYTEEKTDTKQKQVHLDVYDVLEQKTYTLEAYMARKEIELPPSLRQIRYLQFIGQKIYLLAKNWEVWCFDGKWRKVYPDDPQANQLPEYSFFYLPTEGAYLWKITSQDGISLLGPSGEVIKHYPEFNYENCYLSVDEKQRLWCYRSRTDLTILDWSEAPFNKEEGHKLMVLDRMGRTFSHYLDLPEIPGYLDVNKNKRKVALILEGQTFSNDILALIDEAWPEYSLKYLILTTSINNFTAPFLLSDGTVLFPLSDGVLQININRQHFQPFFPEKNIRSLAIHDDQLYAAVHYGEILQRDLQTGNTQLFFSYKLPINILYADDQGLRYGSHKQQTGLISYSSKKAIYISEPKPKGSPFVKCIEILPDSLILLGTTSGVLQIDQKRNQEQQSLGQRQINNFYRDQRGELWAATDRGLYNFNDRSFYLDTLLDGQPLEVAHIYEEPTTNTFWLATHKGLIQWKPKEQHYRQFTKEQGLSDDILHAVYPDQRNRLWISSNNGIMSFDLLSEIVYSYFEKDGLPNNECNQSAHAQDSRGGLYFGGLEGVTYFHPDSIENKTDHLFYPLQIERMLIYNKKGDTLNQISPMFKDERPYYLPRTSSQISIELGLANFRYSRHTSIEWRVKELNGEWRKIGEDYKLFLLKIPYGNFSIQFRVNISDKLVEKQYYGSEFSFYHPSPLYQNFYFWLLIALLAGIGSWILYYWRSQVLREQNELLQKEVLLRTQELDDRTQTVVAQNKKLERLDKAKNQLFNNVNHELRTPLNLIQLSVERLTELIPDERQTYLIRIKGQVDKMGNMLNDILRLNQMDSGVLVAHKQTIEWNSYIRQILGQYEDLANHKQLDLKVEIEVPSSLYLSFDPEKVERVITNLLNNAMKFTPQGGRILFRSAIVDNQLETVVADTGPGIPLEEHHDIFDRYYQGNHSERQAQPGYGIGLALCKEYAALMDGKIWVESIPGQGASFFFTFPLTYGEVAPTATNISPLSEKATQRTFYQVLKNGHKKAKILIVEDNEELLELMAELLSEEYAVSTATNGEIALKLLNQQAADIDLIISDIMMPIVDGFSLLKAVRADANLGYTPFLFVSALNSKDHQLKALRLGVDAYLSKPFSTSELKARIRNLVRNQQIRKAFISKKPAKTQDIPTIPHQAPPIHDGVPGYDEAWMQNLQQTVKENLARLDFKISDIADQMYVSERTLRNRIKEYTGLTPTAYLQQARLDLAMVYIQERKYRTIPEVAYAVGFKDDRYFSKIFKKNFGKLPSDYL